MRVDSLNSIYPTQIQDRLNSFQNHKEKIIRPQFFLPALIPFAIPGFGPVVIQVIPWPAIIAGLTNALSRGANKNRFHEVNNLPKIFCCYESHPESLHHHTLSLDDLPYPKKLKIANAANNVFHAIGEIIFNDRQTFCRKYVEARDRFYDTINYEYKGCKEDYYNIVARDAIRSAWYKYECKEDINQAVQQIEDAINTIKSSPNIVYNRLPVDLIVAKMALHYIADQSDLAMESLGKLSTDRFAYEKLSLEQQSFILQQLHALAIEGYHKKGDLDFDDPLNLMTVIAFRYLCVSHYSNTLKGDFHVGKLIAGLLAALYDNLKLIEKKEMWNILPNALAAGFDPKDFSSINLNVLRGLMQDLTPSAIQTEDLTELFNYNFNSAKFIFNYKAFEFCLKKFAPYVTTEQNEIQARLKKTALDHQEPSFYLVKDEPNSSHQVVIFDTNHIHQQDSKLYFDELKDRVTNHSVSVVHHRYRSTRAFFYPSNDQDLKNNIASDLLYEEIFTKLSQSSCKKLTLSCYSFGLKIIEEVLKNFPEDLLSKLELVVFSPAEFAADLRGVKIVYYQHIQDTMSQIATNALFNKEKPAFVFLNEAVDPKHPEDLDNIYKNKLISLLIE